MKLKMGPLFLKDGGKTNFPIDCSSIKIKVKKSEEKSFLKKIWQ
jgi:hypothetical protein